MAINLQQFLAKQLSDGVIDQQLCDLLNAVADLSKEINDKVTHGALAGVLGFAGTDNVQGEHQKKLDVITNEIFVEGVEWTGALAGMASEEMDHCLPTPAAYKRGKYLIMFDPLDGSSNIDINAPIGTIFSITKAPEGKIADESFLTPGRKQIAAGYVMYSPQTILTLTVGNGVFMFTLNLGTGEYILTKENVRIPGSDTGICDQYVEHETLGSSCSEVRSGTFSRRYRSFGQEFQHALGGCHGC